MDGAVGCGHFSYSVRHSSQRVIYGCDFTLRNQSKINLSLNRRLGHQSAR